MLETLARLEQLRKSRSEGTKGYDDSEHSLLRLAKDMVENSPILFLDEFQLPDRATSKILSNLSTSFFQLGGVLVASSNRMPDELSKAGGMNFAAPPRGGLVRNRLGLGRSGGGLPLGMFPGDNEYVGFVDVLKARCEIWEMNSGRDWRRREAEEMDAEAAEITKPMREEMIRGFSGLEKLEPGNLGTGFKQAVVERISEVPKSDQEDSESSNMVKATTPKKYLLSSSDNEGNWNVVVHLALPSDTSTSVRWETTTLLVYGRQVRVPKHLEGVTYWEFETLVVEHWDLPIISPWLQHSTLSY